MRELVIHCNQDIAEEISDFLMDQGALSVSVEDADRDTEEEQPLYGEPGMELLNYAWQRNHVIALLDDETATEVLLLSMAVAFGEDEYEVASITEVEDKDWVRLTQTQFDPMKLGERIWIVPSWHMTSHDVLQIRQNTDNLVIQLDPGMAFGTGSHATTRLCAEWLEQHPLAGKSVLDYGCGSGILSIIAAKLHAAEVVGIDIDAQSVDTARHNALINESQIYYGLPDELPEGRFDVVVANILANPLKALAPLLANRVKAGGSLVLSGILEGQYEEMIDYYRAWVHLDVWQADEGWVCLHGKVEA
ncbi:50S ribosomal protein L11 methyltransferase [Oligella urethralis]|uniref:50S ribosomal protein L11 methyltransferase n=1 Tax=Oligella urethralis TaxID=90245 RepID=UPI00254E3114|nr:50S ribosomal protein L11 methyltransferase [Oligella urethralis]MDK6202393.1 50S ribosomal protein L11 methyltransferase [Oligella urethralis]